MSLNLAVIGVGKIFQNFHLNAILNQPDVKIKYLVDRNEALVKRIAGQIGAIPLTDAKLIENCDLCFIATPPSVRLDVFNQICDKGMDIIFEKPVAFNLSTARKMIDSVKAYSGNVYITQTRRFFPNLSLVRKFISNNLLGIPVKIELYEGGVFSWVTESNYMKAQNPDDMGVVHDIGSHVFDYLNQLISDCGISPDDVSIQQSKVDFDIMANNFFCKIKAGETDVLVRLSRNILMLNQLKITFKNGEVLTTESGYSNLVTLRTKKDVMAFEVKDEDIVANSFEAVFDKLWSNIISHKLNGKFESRFFEILSETVLPSVTLLDKAISLREVSLVDNFFSTYGYEGIE